MTPLVVALFCRSDSIYKSIPGVEVYDRERDALTFRGGPPVVAHPPCRLFGRLSHLSTAPLAEQHLSLWAVSQVRAYGGVLEHPAHSKLWSMASLPAAGELDSFGGFTLPVLQHDFGHLASKRSWLYICGIRPGQLPRPSIDLTYPTHCVHTSKRGDRRVLKYLSQKSIEATPLAFAEFLVSIARSTLENNYETGCRRSA